MKSNVNYFGGKNKLMIHNLLEYLRGQIVNLKKNRLLMVAIDGVDTSGKTTLSKLITAYLVDKGHSIINASIDGFHNPLEIRYKHGPGSPLSYYLDSFNYDALKENLLEPLRNSSSLEYKTAVYDFRTESYINIEPKKADEGSILIMEGVFLLRPELLNYWDFKIFLHVDFDQVIKRARGRDGYLFGSEEEIELRYRSKYIPGQQLYLRESNPYKVADVIINNNDYNNPSTIKSQDEIKELQKRAFDFI